MQPPPLNEKVLKDKRKKLKETLDRVLKMYVSIRKLLEDNTKKTCESGFPYCFLTDFTKFFFREGMLLDFGFLTREAS